MSRPKLTEASIRELATSQSFGRGQDYYRSGAVWDLERRGETLLAQVEGSSYEPYEVSVQLDAGGVADADCSCPYDWGGCCKHIVAVLLTYVHESETITEHPSISDLMAELDRDALADLLIGLVETHPHLADWVEARITVAKQAPQETSKTEPQPSQHRTPLDPTPFRRQAHSIMGGLSHMRPSEAYWYTGGMVDQLSELIQQAEPFMEAGDGRNALIILDALTEVYVDRWMEFDDSDGELGGFFADLGPALAEAILSADLSPTERTAWADKLTRWQSEIGDYGIDEGFDVAVAAAIQGWDFQPLQRAMQGHISELGAWEGEAPWFADDLAVARLNVLEYQGRTDEYLNLAEAEGQTSRYVSMLVKLGRGQEAVDYGLKYLTIVDDALVLAQALREHELHPQAVQIAQHGLTLHGDTVVLARWLRDYAAAIGRAKVALQAAHVAFASHPSLADYQAVQSLAGTDWSKTKTGLLSHLATEGYISSKVEVYLHEGMVDEVVKVVDAEGPVGYDMLERVVDVAYQSHPDWAIRHCKQQAERIMDRGQSRYYHHAVRWLGKGRQAYEAAGRIDEWRTYLESLIVKHSRKYSLRPQLEGLRK